ncbi:MAG: acetylglutamate kinase, partial [Bacteroidota bacterium]
MMQEKLTIVKVGGAVIEDEKKLVSFMDAFKQIESKKLLVHGGGKMANQLAASLNIEVKMVDGRRVTDDQMIEVVIMAYSSLNKKLSALLESKGIRSVGLTGADGDTIRSVKRPIKNGLDFGWVGDIEKVNDQLFTDLLSIGSVPVMAPLTHDGNGQLLNTNADTIASELAVALSGSFSVSLNYIF